MSWPKAFVRFPDKPKPHDFQRVTVWGFKWKGNYVEDEKRVEAPILAVEAYFPDGRSEDFNWETQLSHQDMIIPLKNVVILNWEASEWLGQTYGITKKWLREQGIRLMADGYGADVKQAELEKP
jgi:hypothetical protein